MRSKLFFKSIRIFFTLFVIFSFVKIPTAWADSSNPNPIDTIDFEQKLNQQLPLELQFTDETGKPVRLGDYFDIKPVLLLFAYYECPMLCNMALNDLAQAISALEFDAGDQYELVTISIDPGETPALAAEKKEIYLSGYDLSEAGIGWHFLTGQGSAVSKLTDAAGFQYTYDPVTDQYAHPTGVIVLTPEGKISSYIFGLGYTGKDLRLAIVDASQKKIGTPVDQFFLLCYQYDPVTGKYTLAIQNVLRIASAITVVAILGLVLFLGRNELFRKFSSSE